MTPTGLKEKRLAMQLTQAELAELLPINLRTYQAWEAGRYSIPSLIDRAMASIEAERGGQNKPAKAKNNP